MSSETQANSADSPAGDEDVQENTEISTNPETKSESPVEMPENSEKPTVPEAESPVAKVPVAPVRKKSRKNLLAPEPPAEPEPEAVPKPVKLEEPSPPAYEERPTQFQKPKILEPLQIVEPPRVQNAPTPEHHFLNARNQNDKEADEHYLPMEVYSTVVASFSFLCIGLMRAYTSPAIASMKDDHEFFNANNPMSRAVISWMAASPPLASFFGTILSGLALQYCGRQKTLVLLTLPFIAGWLLIAFARNTLMVMTGRVLTGFAAGFATAGAQLYVSECVRAKVRGFLGILPAMMLSLGILMGFTMSTINLEWQEFALLMTVFPIVLFLFSISVPESPSWLLMRGKEAQAVKSLQRLRGVHDQVVQNESTSGNAGNVSTKVHKVNLEIQKELDEMKRVITKHHRYLEAGIMEEDDTEPGPRDFVEFVFKDLLGKREIWYPAFVSISLMVFQQFTGANAVIYYLSLILAEAAPENKILSNTSFLAIEPNHRSNQHSVDGGLDPNVSSVILGMVQFLAFFVSLPVIDHLGRRVLLIASAIFMMIPHLVLGAYFYMKMNPDLVIHVYTFESIIRHTYQWLPLLCLCAFIASFSLGFGPIPYLIMSEIFPYHARAWMCALCALVNHLSLFLILRIFPTFIDLLGAHIVFWFLAVVCFFAAIHCAIVVPETRGKTLAEIELSFMHKDRRDSNCSSDVSGGSSSDKKIKKNKGKKSKSAESDGRETRRCSCQIDIVAASK